VKSGESAAIAECEVNLGMSGAGLMPWQTLRPLRFPRRIFPKAAGSRLRILVKYYHWSIDSVRFIIYGPELQPIACKKKVTIITLKIETDDTNPDLCPRSYLLTPLQTTGFLNVDCIIKMQSRCCAVSGRAGCVKKFPDMFGDEGCVCWGVQRGQDVDHLDLRVGFVQVGAPADDRRGSLFGMGSET
jgi:hypothetical protein